MAVRTKQVTKAATTTVVPETTKTVIEAYICDRCGIEATEEECYYGNPPVDWVPIEVHAGKEYEEGWIVVKKIYCGCFGDNCAATVLGILTDLGFNSHFHGSTNLLEADCPGDGHHIDIPRVCPTPEPGMFVD